MSRKYLEDVAERAASTFIQAAVAIILANQVISFDVLKAAAIAGGLAVVKAYGARFVGDPDSAGLTGSKS
jgi:hypothetical protein